MQKVKNARWDCKCGAYFWGERGFRTHIVKEHIRCLGCLGIFTKILRHWHNTPEGCGKEREYAIVPTKELDIPIVEQQTGDYL